MPKGYVTIIGFQELTDRGKRWKFLGWYNTRILAKSHKIPKKILIRQTEF